MRLWLLRPVSEDAKPWCPWYDKNFGFVVRATDELAARAFAQAEGCGEVGYDNAVLAWTDSSLSSCVELTPDGEQGVVMQDLHSA